MSNRPLKAFSWMTVRRYPDADGRTTQLTLVVAATSQAEALRLGKNHGARRDYMGETKNPYEVAAAMAAPGVLLAARRARRYEDGFVPFDPERGLGDPNEAVDAAVAAVEPPAWLNGWKQL